MKCFKEIADSLELLENSYLGVRLQSLTVFVLSIIFMIIAVTGIYWGIYGFNRWHKDITIAGQFMTAATMSPMQQAMLQQQPTISRQRQAGQYICPVHGAVGLPCFNIMGQPLCPVGNEVMQLRTSVASTFPVTAATAAWTPGAG